MSKPKVKFTKLHAEAQRAVFAEWQLDRLWADYLAAKWFTPYLH